MVIHLKRSKGDQVLIELNTFAVGGHGLTFKVMSGSGRPTSRASLQEKVETNASRD